MVASSGLGVFWFCSWDWWGSSPGFESEGVVVEVSGVASSEEGGSGGLWLEGGGSSLGSLECCDDMYTFTKFVKIESCWFIPTNLTFISDRRLRQ